MTNTVTDFSVAPVETEAANDQPETEYMNTLWSQQYGYYKTIPELRAVIDAKARWTIGKGFETDPQTKFILDSIIGFGKDTFNTILENLIRTMNIGGDSFAEIIRDKDDNFVNLKPIDPGTIKIIVNRKGLIKRYEQTTKTKETSITTEFTKESIFHLSRNRTADEVHGISLIDSSTTGLGLVDIILARNEAMADMRQLMHRHVKPIIKWQLDTDDTKKIAEFKAKADQATNKGENIFIPLGAVEHEVVSVPTNATLNPLPWIQQLNQYFFQAAGVPQIIVGGSQEITEATAKILYLAFQQTIEEDQLYIEEQLDIQVGLKIELEFPASLENELLSDQKKAETTQAATPEDTTVQGVELNGSNTEV
ncbi:hypothetical protein CMI41_03660 [Candidatus Pacearchaeota archaeon]|nr:hypothetical protein [Candidatus Pacearchaeota archaeon]